MARTRWPPACETPASCPGQADRTGRAGGCQRLGPGRQAGIKTTRTASRGKAGQTGSQPDHTPAPTQNRGSTAEALSTSSLPYPRSRIGGGGQGSLVTEMRCPRRGTRGHGPGHQDGSDAAPRDAPKAYLAERFRAKGPGSPGGKESKRRSRYATAAASPRLVTPSLARMLDTCTLAVLAEMNSSAAISRLLRPAATSRSTSNSRAVSPS